MTYSEMANAIHSRVHTKLRLTLSESIAWNVIRYLESRGGFDHWWDQVDKETQDEVFAELVKEIESTVIFMKP